MKINHFAILIDENSLNCNLFGSCFLINKSKFLFFYRLLIFFRAVF
jgi:hypothetical protein